MVKTLIQFAYNWKDAHRLIIKKKSCYKIGYKKRTLARMVEKADSL